MDLKQSFFQIKILHAAMFVGVILFAGLSFVFHNFLNVGASLIMLPESALYLIALLAGFLLRLSSVIYKRRISEIDIDLPLEERVGIFRSAAILRIAIIEGASLVLIMGYLLSGHIMYLLIAFLPLYFFIATFPKDEMLIETMELTYSEVQQLS